MKLNKILKFAGAGALILFSYVNELNAQDVNELKEKYRNQMKEVNIENQLDSLKFYTIAPYRSDKSIYEPGGTEWDYLYTVENDVKNLKRLADNNETRHENMIIVIDYGIDAAKRNNVDISHLEQFLPYLIEKVIR